MIFNAFDIVDFAFHFILWVQIIAACKQSCFPLVLRYHVLWNKWKITGNSNVFNLSSLLVLCLQTILLPSPADTLISFLPLAHMFERVVEVGLKFCFSPCFFMFYCFTENTSLGPQWHTHFILTTCTHVWTNDDGKFDVQMTTHYE